MVEVKHSAKKLIGKQCRERQFKEKIANEDKDVQPQIRKRKKEKGGVISH